MISSIKEKDSHKQINQVNNKAEDLNKTTKEKKLNLQKHLAYKSSKSFEIFETRTINNLTRVNTENNISSQIKEAESIIKQEKPFSNPTKTNEDRIICLVKSFQIFYNIIVSNKQKLKEISLSESNYLFQKYLMIIIHQLKTDDEKDCQNVRAQNIVESFHQYSFYILNSIELLGYMPLEVLEPLLRELSSLRSFSTYA